MLGARIFDQDTTTFLQETEDKIVGRTQRWIKDTGRDLLEAKRRIGHGHFVDWIRARFDMSEDTAQNLMNVARNFGEIPNGSVFADRALYLLSRKSTPDDARQEAKDRAIAGEEITFDLAKEIVETKKALKQAQEAKIEAEKKAENFEQQYIWSQAEAELVKSENEGLKQELETRSMPEPQIIEVPTDPADVKERMEKLKDWHKKAVEEREKAKKQVEGIVKYNEHLAESLRRSQKDVSNLLRSQDNDQERAERLYVMDVKRRARESAQEVDRSMRKALSNLPSPVDGRHLDGDEWEMISQATEQLRYALQQFEQLKPGFVSSIIDAGPLQSNNLVLINDVEAVENYLTANDVNTGGSEISTRSSFIPSIPFEEAINSWFIHLGAPYAVKTCTGGVFKNAIQDICAHGGGIGIVFRDDKRALEILSSRYVELPQRWYLIGSLIDYGRPLPLYDGREEAEKALEANEE